MSVRQRSAVVVRDAQDADLARIAAIATETGQSEDWGGANSAYIRHLMRGGRVVVAAAGDAVVGFGAVQRVGAGAAEVSMLCDLFVDPAAHGSGYGRAMLAELWGGARRRMTFSSLNAHAIPLYTTFGVDAWWPLLYLHGAARSVPMPAGWSVAQATPDAVGELELRWTGVVHMAMSAGADDGAAAAAVLAVVASTGGSGRVVRISLPAPTPPCARCSRPADGSTSLTCSWPPTRACSTRAGRCRRPRRHEARGRAPGLEGRVPREVA